MKKVLSALLIMLMLIQTVSYAAAGKIYTDSSTKMLVSKLGMLGIFDQFDDKMYFKDDAAIKRGEAADVLSKMMGMTNSDSDNSAEMKFFDVPSYTKYINAVNHVTDLGIMSGNSAGLFLPDDTMEIAHVLKALVVALGYKWKAEAYGGYPSGYIRVANELELTDVLTKGVHENASRSDFLKLADAALDVPICRIKSISGDKMDFEIDEDVNLLSEYHGIYFDEGVVQNNKRMSITLAADGGEEDVVYIGDKELYVNGVIDVYSYLGYQVEYYYKHNVKEEKSYLLFVIPTDSNHKTHIFKEDYKGFSNGIISYYNENGKLKEIKLGDSAVVLYNGERTTDLAAKINSFEGTMITIDNNDDNLVDVVMVKNLEYDKVKLVKEAENKLNLSSNVLDLNSYESVNIALAQTGEEIGLIDILDGDIIGYAESADQSKLIIDVLGTGSALTITATNDAKDTFTVDNGSTLNKSLLSAEHKTLIKPGKTVSIVLLDGYYAVWAHVASETLSMGYLINIGIDEGLFGETKLLGARILDVSGDINSYKAASEKKMIVNGKSVKVTALEGTLKAVKDSYNLGGDGVVSQVILYKLNDDGAISHIYTLSSDADSSLYLKYGYKTKGVATVYDGGYGTARFGNGIYFSGYGNGFWDNNYYISGAHPIFVVPMQGQKDKSEEYYTVKTFKKDFYKNSGTRYFDSYVGSKQNVVPKALVDFVDEPPAIDLNKEGVIVLVQSAYQNVNSNGDIEYILTGISEKKAVTYVVDGLKVSAESIETKKANVTDVNEEAGFTTGDLAVVKFNNLNKIVEIEKLYDCETRNVRTESQNYVDFMCAYNLSSDGYALETYKDLTQGVPGEERMLLLDLYSQARGTKTLQYFDESQEKVYLNNASDIVDYLQDSKKYTIIFIRHQGSGYYKDESVVFYNYNK